MDTATANEAREHAEGRGRILASQNFRGRAPGGRRGTPARFNASNTRHDDTLNSAATTANGGSPGPEYAATIPASNTARASPSRSAERLCRNATHACTSSRSRDHTHSRDDTPGSSGSGGHFGAGNPNSTRFRADHTDFSNRTRVAPTTAAKPSTSHTSSPDTSNHLH